MASRYIPPALRNKTANSEQPTIRKSKSISKDELYTAEKLENHFWPLIEGENDSAGSDLTFGQHGRLGTTTLHACKARPSELAYVILFRGANPRWNDENIIYVKSNLDLLPLPPGNQEHAPGPNHGTNPDAEPGPNIQQSYPEQSNSEQRITETSISSSPIAIYQEVSGPRPRIIRFAGWHVIDKLEILQPHSPELVRMLDQKWTRTNKSGHVIKKERDAESWKQSMSLKWAVIKFRPDTRSDENLGPPQIETLPEDNSHGVGPGKKSVDEMLAALRMRGSEDSTNDGSTVAHATEDDQA